MVASRERSRGGEIIEDTGILAAIEGPTVSNPSFHMRLRRIAGHLLLAAADITRTFALNGDRLTITAVGVEAHQRAATRWVWSAPPLRGLPA